MNLFIIWRWGSCIPKVHKLKYGVIRNSNSISKVAKAYTRNKSLYVRHMTNHFNESYLIHLKDN